MIHVGDITKLHGEDIEPVDVITFGSPCQDLSTAGQRAGLYGEKSSLFLDAVRVISEPIRPTFFVRDGRLAISTKIFSSLRGRGLRKQYPAMQKRQGRPQPRATSTIYIEQGCEDMAQQCNDLLK